MTTTTALVGPIDVGRVIFHGGLPDLPWKIRARSHSSVAYAPPVNTLDPRFDACTDHRVACDCREAEWAEERREASLERRKLVEAIDRELAGHATFTYGVGPQCQCSGCRIARAAYLHPAQVWTPFADAEEGDAALLGLGLSRHDGDKHVWWTPRTPNDAEPGVYVDYAWWADNRKDRTWSVQGIEQGSMHTVACGITDMDVLRLIVTDTLSRYRSGR